MRLSAVRSHWKDYPITEAEFRARQGKWDESGRRLT